MNGLLLSSSATPFFLILYGLISPDLEGGGIYSSFGVENAVFVGLEKHHDSQAETTREATRSE